MSILRTAVVMFVALVAVAPAASAATAYLQVIHNAPDPDAAEVDIYVNGTLEIDNFKFRDATPFLEVPAGVQFVVGVAPGTSASEKDVIADFPFTLADGERYVAIASGVLDPSKFDQSANGGAIAFDIIARAGIRTRAFWNFVNLVAYHGSPDAPTVDVRAREAIFNPIFNDLSYGEFSDYRPVYARKYILDVTPGSDKNTVVASYVADLSGLGGGAAVVFASGFLTPPANQNGEAFGLFAALGDGTVVPLPPLEQKAYVQVVHNAPDPGAEKVDVYLDGDLLLDNFAFRTATPFVDVDAGREIEIAVAGPNSADVGDALATFKYTLEAGQTYALFANGVLSTKDFAPNPDGIDIGFNLFPRGNVKKSNSFAYTVKFLAFHGSPDAPAVDIIANTRWGGLRVISDLAYTDYSRYRWLFPRKYVLNVLPAGTDQVVASFEADLNGLGGGTAILFASGFLNPTANSNGPGFGLYAVFPDGTVAMLPAVEANKYALTNGPIVTSAPQLEDRLGQNYPNPFNPRTTISFSLSREAPVTLNVFNARGQLVSTLVNERLGAGPHEFDFNADGLASGVYFYRLEAGTFREMKKMVLLK